MQGKAGVVVGLYRHCCPRNLQHSGKAAPLRAAKHRQQPAQQPVPPGAAEQKLPRAHRQKHAQVVGLYPGQHHRAAQQAVQRRIPPAQPGKAAHPGHAVAHRHHPAAAGDFI